MLLKSIFKYNLQDCGLTSTDSEHKILVVSFEHGNVFSGYIKTGNVFNQMGNSGSQADKLCGVS